MSLTLRQKLLLTMGGLVAAILVLSGGIDIVTQHRVRAAALRLRAKLVAKAQAAALANAIWEYDQDAGLAALDGSLQDHEFLEATVTDDTGKTFAHVAQKVDGGAGGPGEHAEADVVAVTAPIELLTAAGEKRALGRIDLRYSKHLLARRLRIALLWALGQLFLLVTVVVAGMNLGLRRFTRPIEELTQVIRRRARGDLSLDVSPQYLKRDDEIGAIAQSLELDQQQRRDEARLLEITSDVSADAHAGTFLRRLSVAGQELLSAERCTVFVFDRKGDLLWAPGETEGAPRCEHPARLGITGEAFSDGQVVKLEEASADARFMAAIDGAGGSLLCVPLITKRGARVGVLQAKNRSGGPFTERDELRLRSLAAQAALALENARLLDDVLDEKAFTDSILGSLSDAVVALDPELRVTQANGAAGALFGWDPTQVRGQTLRGLLPDEENDYEIGLLERVARTGKADTAEDTDLRLPDGKLLTVNLKAAPLASAKGEAIGSLFVVEDITSEKRVRGTMARYLPKKVIDQLLEGDRAALGGTTQTVTALFSDIRSFTTISEELGARATVTMLNEYFTEMLEVLDQHGGVLDKFIGDAVMAIFGVPFSGESDADQAVAAAGGMITSLGALNQKRRGRGQQPIAIGIGLNTGEAVAGNIGSPKRMSYTVIGDSVNLASRLEGATKVYGAAILLSEFTYRALKDRSHVREVDVLRVKGKLQPVRVYESYAYRDDRDSDAFKRAVDLSAKGIAAFRERRWDDARSCFEAIHRWRPEDPLADVYLERIGLYEQVPPADGWDGVWVMKSK